MQRSKEELIKTYNSLIGDTPTEEQLTFMEDLSDSFVTPTDEYKEKYEAVLQKYRERFLGNDVQSDIKQTVGTEKTDEPDTAETINPAPEFKDIFTTTYIRR